MTQSLFLNQPCGAEIILSIPDLENILSVILGKKKTKKTINKSLNSTTLKKNVCYFSQGYKFCHLKFQKTNYHFLLEQKAGEVCRTAA